MSKNQSISNSEDLDAFAKSIGWFDLEPSEYTGTGDFRTRKAPSAKAKQFAIGTRRTGLDGNEWIIVATKNGTKRWQKISHNTNTLQNGKDLVKQPKEMLEKVALTMSYQDIMRLCQTNTLIHSKLCQNENFWQKKYQRDFGALPKCFPAKSYYIAKMTRNKKLVEVLDKMINFNDLNFQKQTEAYSYLEKELKRVFKEYGVKVDSKRLRNYLLNIIVDGIRIYKYEIDELMNRLAKHDYVIEFDLILRLLHTLILKYNPVVKAMYENEDIDDEMTWDASGAQFIVNEGLVSKSIKGLSEIEGVSIKDDWIIPFRRNI